MQDNFENEVVLWDCFRKGNRLAYAYLYKKYIYLLLSYGMQLTPDRELVKDCAQEVFIRLYTYKETIKPEQIKVYLLVCMNKIKLRASIGRTGNDDTGGDRFLYRATFKTDDYTFAQGIGSTGSSNSLGTGIHDVLFKNTDIHWEIEDKRDIGLDLGFFNNQIEITADYFNNRRHDILMQRNTVPQTSGFWAAPCLEVIFQKPGELPVNFIMEETVI